MFNFHTCKCIAFTKLYSNFVHLSSLLNLFFVSQSRPKDEIEGKSRYFYTSSLPSP